MLILLRYVTLWNETVFTETRKLLEYDFEYWVYTCISQLFHYIQILSCVTQNSGLHYDSFIHVYNCIYTTATHLYLFVPSSYSCGSPSSFQLVPYFHAMCMCLGVCVCPSELHWGCFQEHRWGGFMGGLSRDYTIKENVPPSSRNL